MVPFLSLLLLGVTIICIFKFLHMNGYKIKIGFGDELNDEWYDFDECSKNRNVKKRNNETDNDSEK